MNNVSHLYFMAELRQMMSHNIVKNISKLERRVKFL